MNRTRHWTLFVAGFLAWCSEGNTLPPETDLQSARMRENVGSVDRTTHYGEALQAVRFAGEIPVSYETTYLEHEEQVCLVAVKHEKLSDVIARFCEISNGLYTSTVIGGYPIIKPASADIEPVTSALDVPISITLHESSTWDALKQFVQELNASPELPRYVRLEIGSIYGGIRPPSELTEAESLTMSASDMTARDVLCRIMEESPIPDIQYALFNAAQGLFISFPHDSGFSLNNTMEKDELIAWIEELGDFSKECKEIYESSRK